MPNYQPCSDPLKEPKEGKGTAYLFFTLAVVTAGLTLWRTADKLSSASWPSTSAEVLRSDMYQQRAKWCVKLRYRYIIDKKEYISSAVSTSWIGSEGCDHNKAIIAARLAQFKSNTPIQIRYKPSNPARGIVYPGKLDGLDFFFPLCATIFVFGGLSVLRGQRRAAA